MAKLISVYYPAKLRICPARFNHYKYMAYNVPLYIYESEYKFPGKIFFVYAGLKTSCCKEFETRQETINDVVYIRGLTMSNHEYIFEVGEDDYSMFSVNSIA